MTPCSGTPVVKGGLRPPVTWSYSALTGFEACPHRHYAVKVARTHAERVSEANAPGQDAHRAFEAHVKKGAALPPGLSRYERMLRHLRETSHRVQAEARIGLDHELRPVGFFDTRVWCRVVIDVLADRGASVVALDWKTGKPRDNEDQGRLSCVAALAANPEARMAAALFVYTNHDVQHKYAVRREEMGEIIDGFAPRLTRLEYSFAHNDWPKTPGWTCRFCPVFECEYNKSQE
jgi:FAD/FMN-containing dehydrogenase